VASRKIIEAATRAGINSQVLTIESDAGAIKNHKNWIAVSSKIKSQFLPSAFLTADDWLASVNILSRLNFSNNNLIHILNVTKEAYVIAHSLLRVKKPLLVHFFHSQHVLADDVFLMRNIALRAGLFGRVLDNHILTTTLSMSRFLVNTLGIDQGRVHYAPYPIDTDKFKPLRDIHGLREKHRLPSDHPIVAYVGSLQPARGLSVLVKAFQHVINRLPRALLLVSHPQRCEEVIYEKSLGELVRNLKIGNNVIIRGASSNIEEIYNLSDVLVLPLVRPYWVDPPLVLLEAMSSGSAVIATPVGAIGDVLSDQKNALLARFGDPLDLAEAIIQLLQNPRKSRKLGENARETVVQNYSYEVVGKNLSKIYQLVLDCQN